MDRDLAIALHYEARALLRSGGAAFEVAADGGAAVAPVDQLALHRRFGRPIDLIEAARERHGVVAAVGLGSEVERLDGGEPVRHLGFRDQVAAAELDAIEAELARGDVEQPLAEEIGFIAPRPAIGSRRRLVGHHQGDVDTHVRNTVGPGQHLRDVARGGRTVGADVGALVGVGLPAQREDGTVRLAGDLQLALGVAGVIGGGEMLAAILDPLHRSARAASGERDEKILRVELAARAEAAADVVFHHADGPFRQSNLPRQHAPVHEGDLGRAVNRQLTARGIPFCQQAARLHRHSTVALYREALAADVSRACEGLICVPAHAGERERKIAARPVEQQDIVSRGGSTVHHCRQRLDVGRDRVERVLGGGGAFRQDHGKGLADIAHLVTCDDRLLERLEGGRRFRRSGMVGTLAPISAAVTTACTPGHDRAAETSIERMRPCATALRRITACSGSSRARSSTNWPRPRRKRTSSMRSTGLPTKALRVAPFRRSAVMPRGAALISRWSPVG